MTHYLLHADADSFVASVVLRSRPELRAVPMAVVVHTFIASPNYPARDRGVRGGMTVREAVRLCPQLVMVDVPREEVEEVGDALFDLFHSVARAVEPGSIEEAFLDVGARDRETAEEAGRGLRHRAMGELGIPVSVGIGRTKLMAKLASRHAKPDGMYVIDAHEEARLRVELPMREAWGVGGTTLERLTQLGVLRLGDLDAIPRDHLLEACGTTMARRLWGMRDGTDDAVVHPVEARTALSAEGAISGYNRVDHSPFELMQLCVARACKRVSRAGLVATGLTLALRIDSRAVTLRSGARDATADPEAWLDAGAALLETAPPAPITALRATLTGLRPASQVMPTLF